MVLSQNMRRSNFYLQDSRLWFEGHLQRNYENESGTECERWVSSASVEEVTRVSRTAAAGQEQKPTFKWEGIVFLFQSTPYHTVFPHLFCRCGLKIYVKLCKWRLSFVIPTFWRQVGTCRFTHQMKIKRENKYFSGWMGGDTPQSQQWPLHWSSLDCISWRYSSVCFFSP